MASIAKNPDNTVASADVTNPNDGWANGGVACATGTASGSTATYNFTGTPFDLPDAASITGIQVDIKWGLNDNNDSLTVELQDADAAWQSKALANKQVADCAATTNSQLGADGDLWGGSFSRAHIESANFQVRWTNVASAKAADTYVDSVLVTVYYELVSEELLAKFAIQAALSAGSEELSAKFEVQQSGSAELLVRAEIRQSGSAELLGNAEIQQLGSSELLGEFVVRHAASVDLLGKFTLRQLTSDLYANFRVSCPRLMGSNWQRKMWYDGTYYWRSRYDPIGDELIFEYIDEDGLADSVWAKNAAASIDASGFSGIGADFTVRSGDGTIPTTIHYSDGIDTIVAESDEASLTGWAWENTTTVFDGTDPDWYRYPNLTADQQASPQLWATAVFYDQSSGKQWVKASQETSSGDITGWDAAVDVSNVDNTATIYGESIRSMGAAAGADVMVVYKEGDALRSRYYDGDWDDTIEDIDTTTLAGKSQWDFEQGMQPKMGHVLYVDADNSVQWTERAAGAASVWEAAEEIGAQTAHTHRGLGIVEHGSGWLWTTWANQDTVEVEYRLHLCTPETWMPPLVADPQTFDATSAVISTTTIAQLQTPDAQPAGSAVVITWIGETAPISPCAVGWGIIVPSAHRDLLIKFQVGQNSADLIARFDAQASFNLFAKFVSRQSGSSELLGKTIVKNAGSAELLGNAEVRQSGSAELLGRFEAQGIADLLGNVEVQQSGSAELLGKFEAQDVADLLGNAEVKNIDSAELLGRFEAQDTVDLLGEVDVRQLASAELLGKFETQAIAELLGKAVIGIESDSAELLGKVEVQQSGSVELLGKFETQAIAELLVRTEVRQSGSAELMGKADVQQSGSAELLGKADVRQSGSVELLGKFEAQAIAELLGKTEIQQSDSAELLGKADVQQSGSAELLGKADVRQSGSVELLGKFEAQAIAELLGKAVIGIESDSAELLGKADVQQSGSAELLGKAEIQQSGSAELLSKFEAQGIADLLGKFDVGQDSQDLLGKFESQAIADLLGKFDVGQDSQDLLGRFEAQVTAELLAKFDVGQDSQDLLGRFEAQGVADLLGKFEAQDTADLLGKFEAQGIADLLGKFDVGQDSQDLLGRFEAQVTAELLGKFEVQGSGSAELLGRFEAQVTAELLSKFSIPSIYSLTGITKDKTGNRLANCEIALFRMMGGSPPIYLFIESDVSDGNGDYSFTNLIKTKYFVRAQKDGSPNIFDTTDNELEPV